MGSTYQRGSRWWIQYRHNGNTVRESSKSDLKGDAENLLKNRLAQIIGGSFAGPKMERITIGELLDDLERDYKTNGKSWHDFADPIVRVHLRPHFGNMRASRLTTVEVQRYISGRRKTRAANATINRECALLKRAFSLGQKQTPPKVARIPAIPKLEENNVRKGFLEYADFVALRHALPEEIRAILTFAFYTGCRKGEILSLRWSQVDLANRIVRLEPGTTKNDHARELPLSPEPYEMLAMQKAIRDTFYRDCPWVFFRKGKPITDLRGAWEAACKQVGLTDADGRPTRIFHDLRRTGIRNLIRAGIPQSVAMKISGHRTDSVFRRYDIVTQQDLQDAARRLGLYVEEARAKLKKEAISTDLAQSGLTSRVPDSTGNAKLLKN
jgi:integrase